MDRADRNRYGAVTRLLHWTTVLAITAQFVVGYALDVGGQGRGRGRGRGRGEGSGRGRGRGRGGDYDVFGDDALLTTHVVLGAAILVLVVIRLIWRSRTTLPPWAPTLSSFERSLAHWTERVLYVVMIAIPTTGLVLVLTDDGVLPLHVAAHVAFFAAIASHVGLVVKHQVVDRDRLLRRML